MLIYKKNELKRLIRSNSLPSKVENKNTQKIIQNNGDISHLFGSKTLSNLDKQISKDNTKYLEGENDLKNNVKEHELEDFKKYMEKQGDVDLKNKSKKKLFSKNKNNENKNESDN